MRNLLFYFFVLYCCSSLFEPTSYAQSLQVPVEVQYPLLQKILTFDRNFSVRNRGVINIAVLFQSRYRLSAVTKTALENIHSGGEIVVSGKPVRLFPLNLSETTDISSFCTTNKISCLYVLPLRSFDIEKITDISRSLKIFSFSAEAQLAEEGLSCATALVNDKPIIIINLNASRQEGTDFNAQLLKLARIIGE